jgi:hypothetical protein
MSSHRPARKTQTARVVRLSKHPVKAAGLAASRAFAGGLPRPSFGEGGNFRGEPFGVVGVGIEVVADPFSEFGVAFVLGILDRLEWRGEWKPPPLNGIATAPLLHEDGTIKSAEGYDSNSGMWCERVPDLTGLVSDHPTKVDATTALRLVRSTFKTFCFACSH